MNITIDAQLVRAAQANQGRNDIRQKLNGILLAANGDIVGTDGHSMFKSVYTNDETPAVPEDIIINIDGNIPVSADTVTFNFDHCQASTGKRLFMFNVINAEFPAYERVIPKADRDNPGETVRLDSTLLARVLKTFGKGNPVDVDFAGEHDSVRITSPKMNDGVLVIMPLRR
jgi:DNA polymerase III sliding clamp (beta) subunit (PCNA family)